MELQFRARGGIVSLFNFAKGASHTGSVSHTGRIFSKVYTPKRDISELSEGNGRFQKRAERIFGEKRV